MFFLSKDGSLVVLLLNTSDHIAPYEDRYDINGSRQKVPSKLHVINKALFFMTF